MDVNIPFKHDIDEDYGIRNPDKIPLFVIRMMVPIMEKESGDLYTRYLKAFKFTLNKYIGNGELLILNRGIEVSRKGFEKEALAMKKLDKSELKGKEDSSTLLRKFQHYMGVLGEKI